jgi:hypothetical protein
MTIQAAFPFAEQVRISPPSPLTHPDVQISCIPFLTGGLRWHLSFQFALGVMGGHSRSGPSASYPKPYGRIRRHGLFRVRTNIEPLTATMSNIAVRSIRYDPIQGSAVRCGVSQSMAIGTGAAKSERSGEGAARHAAVVDPASQRAQSPATAPHVSDRVPALI